MVLLQPRRRGPIARMRNVEINFVVAGNVLISIETLTFRAMDPRLRDDDVVFGFSKRWHRDS